MLVFTALTITGCNMTNRNNTGPDTTNLQPVEVQSRYAGQYASFEKPGVYILNTPAQLSELDGNIDASQVDFSNQSVVVLAAGTRPTGGYWAYLTSLQLAGNMLYVQGRVNSPGQGAMTTQALTQPWSAVVVPKLPANLMVVPEIESTVGMPLPLE
jgi:hypothetical protein